MSIRISARVWDNTEVEGTARLMLLALAWHADDDGLCWPSLDMLARECRISVRQAQRLIAHLEAGGHIQVERGTGRGNASRYTVKGDIQRERVTSSARKGDIPPHAHVEPSLEPSLTAIVSESRAAAAPPAPPAPPAPVVAEQPPQPQPQPQPKPAKPPKPKPNPKPTEARPPAVDVYREVLGKFPNHATWPLLEPITDLGKWRDILREWVARGYRPDNVKGPLEVYRDGWRAPPTNGYHANGANGPNGRRPLPMEVDASSYVRASTPILEGFDEEDFP
jgi:hypothetical protein